MHSRTGSSPSETDLEGAVHLPSCEANWSFSRGPKACFFRLSRLELLHSCLSGTFCYFQQTVPTCSYALCHSHLHPCNVAGVFFPKKQCHCALQTLCKESSAILIRGLFNTTEHASSPTQLILSPTCTCSQKSLTRNRPARRKEALGKSALEPYLMS